MVHVNHTDHITQLACSPLLSSLFVPFPTTCRLAEKKDIRTGNWTGPEIDVLSTCNFLSAKPVIYLVNISKKDLLKGTNKYIKDIREWASVRSPGAPVIPYSGSVESDLVAMGPEAAKEWLKENKCKSMLPRIIKTGTFTIMHVGRGMRDSCLRYIIAVFCVCVCVSFVHTTALLCLSASRAYRKRSGNR